MNRFKYLLYSMLFLLVPYAATGQQHVEMADPMRAQGKIYVVVAIIVIILAGLIFYLFLLDRKVKKLENLLRERQPQTK